MWAGNKEGKEISLLFLLLYFLFFIFLLFWGPILPGIKLALSQKPGLSDCDCLKCSIRNETSP